jgi:hypothetical protein
MKRWAQVAPGFGRFAKTYNRLIIALCLHKASTKKGSYSLA